MSNLLKFARGNAKLGKNVHTFSLPAGFTCPGALECLSKADKVTGKLTDGSQNKFRCFSASAENQYPNVRLQRWHNFDLLRNAQYTLDMHMLINASLPKKRDIVRIHVSGDFFNESYFIAWMNTAFLYPDTKFYFYTKSLNFWVNHIDKIGTGHTPGKINNFIPTASRGGRFDEYIDKYGLREAKVVFSKAEAKSLRLSIDHDDSHAMKFGKSFALLLHGQQPKGSEASKALQNLKKVGINGYSRKIALPTI